MEDRKMKFIWQLLFLGILTFCLSSCSMFTTRNIVGGPKEKKVVTTVPKKQYDEISSLKHDYQTFVSLHKREFPLSNQGVFEEEIL
jgi:hypothetical protein